MPFDKLNGNYYLKVWEFPRQIVIGDTSPEYWIQKAQSHSRVWWLATEADDIPGRILAREMFFCQRPVKRGDLVLTLYARNEADCA